MILQQLFSSFRATTSGSSMSKSTIGPLSPVHHTLPHNYTCWNEMIGCSDKYVNRGETDGSEWLQSIRSPSLYEEVVDETCRTTSYSPHSSVLILLQWMIRFFVFFTTFYNLNHDTCSLEHENHRRPKNPHMQTSHDIIHQCFSTTGYKGWMMQSPASSLEKQFDIWGGTSLLRVWRSSWHSK